MNNVCFGGGALREEFVWDEKGRLKQRILWQSDDAGDMNGSYNFVYKTACDLVHVEPVDYYFNWDAKSKKGFYDGSFGKIPEKGDPGYNLFVEDPYGVKFDKATSDSILVRQQKRCEDYKKSLKKNLKK